MGSSAIDLGLAIQLARQEGGDALGGLLQRYRNYLYLLADAQVGRLIGQRVSASDIVQETMLAAQRDFVSFRGTSAGELTSWLKTILSRALVREFERHVTAEKRDVRREVSIDTVGAGLDSSCARATQLFPWPGADPADIVSASEQSRRVADLIAMLPDDYRYVVMQKYFAELGTDQIAKKMNRSPQAIRLLWMRALRRLRALYDESEGAI